jgi:hypothetical protein
MINYLRNLDFKIQIVLVLLIISIIFGIAYGLKYKIISGSQSNNDTSITNPVNTILKSLDITSTPYPSENNIIPDWTIDVTNTPYPSENNIIPDWTIGVTKTPSPTTPSPTTPSPTTPSPTTPRPTTPRPTTPSPTTPSPTTPSPTTPRPTTPRPTTPSPTTPSPTTPRPTTPTWYKFTNTFISDGEYIERTSVDEATCLNKCKNNQNCAAIMINWGNECSLIPASNVYLLYNRYGSMTNFNPDGRVAYVNTRAGSSLRSDIGSPVNI